MTERPMIFSAQSVQAIQVGRKSQTRRVVKNLGYIQYVTDGVPGYEDKFGNHHDTVERCPHGVVGDHLWVRETWGVSIAYDTYSPSKISRHVGEVAYKSGGGYDFESGSQRGRWRSPLFMPRWASRITLEVMDVRVQRLQDISEDDALAEGIKKFTYGEEFGEEHTGTGYGTQRFALFVMSHSATSAYENMWNEINGKKTPWEHDPWVFAITFRVVEQPNDAR